MSLIPDNEFTLHSFKDLLLKQHVLFLSLGNNVLLADSLHGVIFSMGQGGHLRRAKTVISAKYFTTPVPKRVRTMCEMFKFSCQVTM